VQLSELIDFYRDSSLWHPHSWQSYPAAQQPEWESSSGLSAVTEQLGRMPGLVGSGEIESLKQQISDAGLGRRFILQGGDCAERFQDCRESLIRGKMRIIMQMALVMGYAGRRPIVPIGRMAGQYAKPRSEPHEFSSNGVRLPIFRGESVNSFEATSNGRRSDPLRLLQAYHTSGATLNFIRMLMGNGFGDLQNIDGWYLGNLKQGPMWTRYEQIALGLRDAMAFMSSVSGSCSDSALRGYGFKDFFVSHEALLLPYEQALTRFVAETGRYYNLSTHMLWIGDRTRKVGSAHVEYCRGVGNPVGIKVSAETNIDELLDVIGRINPHNEAGKVTLITRLGTAHVKEKLPKFIEALRDSGLSVTWSVDPMHGNTVRTEDGRKTRRFEAIVGEIQQSFDVHRELGSILGGVHLEMTSDDVTECTGGTSGVSDESLHSRYETWCDPRLNGAQSLEIAFAIANCLRKDQAKNLI
jgi:3-deoxy-7-phosphoheptulonate synthase